MLKEKIWVNFQRIMELFTQKVVTKLSKYGFGIRDPGSEIREKPIPDPGSRGQKGTGSRIQIRNTGLFLPSFLHVQYKKNLGPQHRCRQNENCAPGTVDEDDSWKHTSTLEAVMNMVPSLCACMSAMAFWWSETSFSFLCVFRSHCTRSPLSWPRQRVRVQTSVVDQAF